MFLYHLIILTLAWGFFIASEKIFPKPLASISEINDWGTMLLFKPLHLLLSLLCFCSAFFLIRWVVIKCGKLVFGKGVTSKFNRVYAMTCLILGLWVVSLIYIQHPVATAVFAGGMVIYDFSDYIMSSRKKKRLQTMLRQFQK